MSEVWDYDPKSLSIFTMDEGSPVLLFQPHEMCDGDSIPWDEMVAKTRIAAAGPELLRWLTWASDKLMWLYDDSEGHDAIKEVVAKATGAA